jgi:phosphoadenosine phosphosulfate reductase
MSRNAALGVRAPSESNPPLEEAAEARARILAQRYDGVSGAELLAAMIEREFPGEITLVSSFGAEAAVLLHMAARIDPSIPVTFVDTGRLFPATLKYRDQLVEYFGLNEVRTVSPDVARVGGPDGDGELWRRDPDLCCFLRKVEPLSRALEGFAAWITGRKAYQGGMRHNLQPVEAFEGRIKINPLARWSPSEIKTYFEAHGLPRHPLEAEGFPSIGCMPCTDRVAPGEHVRAGRWRGQDKDECGIHFDADGVQRGA